MGSPDKNVKMFLKRSPNRLKERFATRSPDRSLSKYPNRNATTCPSKFPSKNVRTFLNNSAIIFQDKAAQHSTFVQFVNSRPTVKSLILVFYSLFSIKQIPSSQTSI